MELNVVSSINLVFKHCPCAQKTLTSRMASLCVEHLDELRPGSFGSLNLLSKLSSALVAQTLPDAQIKQSKNLFDNRLFLTLFYGFIASENSTQTKTAIWQIKDANSADGLFKRLIGVCGGPQNITANLELEMDDKIKLSFNDAKMWNAGMLQEDFNLSEMLIQKWAATTNAFSGTVSLTLKLNEQALNRIYGGSLIVGEQVNRKLLDDAEESGDAVIVVDNGAMVKCHKVFLTAQSEVFKAMFQTEMQEAKTNNVKMTDITEAGLKALLAFLYCRDITEALRSTPTAVELLQASDKYGIEGLYEIMKGLVLDLEHESFSVASAVQLLTLVAGRKDDSSLGKIEEKAKNILKLKSDNELDECEEFRNFFNNPDSGLSMCFYLRETK